MFNMIDFVRVVFVLGVAGVSIFLLWRLFLHCLGAIVRTVKRNSR